MPAAMVIGSPISHSLSPVLHSAGFAAAGLAEWRYGRAEVTAETFAAFMQELPDDVRALSVTMPCKEPALAFAEHPSALAQQVGAANTLYRTDAGWAAENTDVAGIVNALRRAGCAHARTAVVLGSGATARSALAALRQLGVEQVTFAVRSEPRPETVALATASGIEVATVPLTQLGQQAAQTDLTVSTLPSGAADAVAEQLSGRDLTGRYLFDVVYAPWPSLLAAVGQRGGAQIVSGLEMLIEQAAVQFELFTGVAAPISDMRAAGYAAMK